MSEYVLADKDSLTKIANALRSVSGSNETYTVPELSAAAAQTISLGGGSIAVQADWNQSDENAADYIKNKPFGEITVTELVYLAETTVEVDPDEGAGYILNPPENPVMEGENYTINWNGVEYNSTAQVIPAAGGLVVVAMGNLGVITGGDDTGEPFIVMIIPEEYTEAADGMYGGIYALDGSTSVTLSITQHVETESKLDNKYLDLFWLPTEMSDNAEIEWLAETETDSGAGNMWISPTRADMTQFVEGNKIVIYIDGERYESTIRSIGVNGNTIIYAGNLGGLGADAPNTGEPYVMFAAASDVDGVTQGVQLNVATSDNIPAKVIINMIGYGLNKLPVQFLPEGYIKRLISEALADFSSAEEASF